MRTAVCSGSFDPVTNGHIDIIQRSAELVDKLIVAVFINPNKHPFFTIEERVALLEEATCGIPNVEVDAFSGLLNEYVRQRGARLIVRGLRAFSDFEYEFQRALLIRSIDPEIETAFFMTRGEYSYLSSSGVRELARFGGKIDHLVPPCVEKALTQKMHILQNKPKE